MKRNKCRDTRFKDKYGHRIFEGDYVHVQQYGPDDPNWVGSLNYEGIVEKWDELGWCVVYYDICGQEPESISLFPKKYREVLEKDKEYREILAIRSVNF